MKAGVSNLGQAEAYLEPGQITTMELFRENSYQLDDLYAWLGSKYATAGHVIVCIKSLGESLDCQLAWVTD